jgi:membrane AbrB-like protein
VRPDLSATDLRRGKARSLAAARWVALFVGCDLLGDLARSIGVPAAPLLMSLLVGVALALASRTPAPFPRRAHRGSQAVVGVLMGSYLDPAAVRSVAGSVLPLVGVTLATVGLCVVVALGLCRWTAVGRSEAVLGMVPGGSAAIIACADDLSADSRTVAFMQYLRVGLVAATAPAVVLIVHAALHTPSSGGGDTGGWDLLPETTQLVSSPRQVAGVFVLTALCLLGMQLGARLGLPAPALLGPMILTAVGVFSGAAQGFTPSGLLQDIVFIAVGLEVGLRFTRAAVRHVGRLAPGVLAATVVVCGGCALFAAGLAALLGIPFLDAYLATTPGGINAVLATSASLHSSVALISTTQSIRLFAVVLLAPPLIRRLTAPPRQPEPTVATLDLRVLEPPELPPVSLVAAGSGILLEPR